MMRRYIFIKYLQLLRFLIQYKRSFFSILYNIRKKAQIYRFLLIIASIFSWKGKIKLLEFDRQYGEVITRCYKRIDKSKFASFELYVIIARNLCNLNQLKDAINCIEKAKIINPYSAEIYYEEGIIYFLMKRYVKARQAFEYAENLGLNSVPLQIHLGKIYYQLGSLNKAETCFRKVLQIYPSEGSIHFLLGVVLMNKMQFTEAEMAFLNAIEYGSDQKEEHLGLAEIYTRRGEWYKAIYEYKKILKYIPDCFVAHYFLGLIYDIQGRENEAIQELIKANKLNPHDEDTKIKLTKILERVPQL